MEFNVSTTGRDTPMSASARPEVGAGRAVSLNFLSRRQAVAVFGLLLAAILGLAIVLRFTGIRSVGFQISDEAMYARHGRFFRQLSVLKPADLQLGAKNTERQEIARLKRVAAGLVERWNRSGEDFYNKPTFGHAVLTGAMMLLVGPADYAPHLVAACFGCATLLFVFLIARDLFGNVAAFFAVAFMAVSRYWLYYSRSALGETDSVFFLTAGLWWYLRCVRRSTRDVPHMALTGLLFGIGTVCHYRWMILFPAFLAIEWFFDKSGRRARIKPGLVALGCYAVPMVLMEIPFYLMLLVSNMAEMPLNHIYTYFINLADVYLKSNQTAFNLSVLFVYPLYYLLNDGILALAAALAGLVQLLRRRRGQDLALARYLGLVLLLLVFQRYVVERALSAALPVLAVLAGAGISGAVEWLSERLRLPRAAMLAIAAALVIGLGLFHSLPLLSARSGIREAAGFLRDQGATRVVFASEELGKLAYTYYGSTFQVESAADFSEVKGQAQAGTRWLVFDRGPYLFADPASIAQWERIREELLSRSRPTFTVPHGDGDWMNFCFENSTPFRESWRRWRQYRHDPPRAIEIFDLTRLSG